MISKALCTLCLMAFALSPGPAPAQTLEITNAIQSYASLSNTTVIMTGHSELYLTANANPLPNSAVQLNSPDAWLFLPNIRPSVAVASDLSQLTVNGANAIADNNVRVVQYVNGTVVIPHAPSFQPLQVFTGPGFTGSSNKLSQYSAYAGANLGAFDQAISSFRLKRGYMATLAQNVNGSGTSKCYVAQDGDLDVSVLPGTLDDKVRFVRIFPWRWTGKKGIAGNIPQNLNVRWYYDWNIDQNSTRDWEYVPIRQTRYWPGLSQNWQTRGANTLLGYNEPDNSTQDAYCTPAEAVAAWPDLLATGLRVGSPAVTDGGSSWLYSFIDLADAAGLRVDFVPVHYYRCYGNAADPDGATTQFYNFLKGIYDRTQRPLWVTEWNNGADWTTCADPTAAQQQATVAKMIEMLDNAPFVERYALYNWVEDVRRVQWDDGSLTAAGVTYRDKVSPMAYTQEGLPGGGRKIARFQFENDVLDSSGFGNNGIAVGIPGYVAGTNGQAVQLDGTNSYIQLPVNTANSPAFSFAAWVRWGGGANWQRIFDFGNDTTHYLFLSPSSGSGTLRFAICNGGSEQIIQTTALPVGQWRHVTVTLSGSTARLYVNGVLVSTSAAFSIAPSQFNPKKNYLGKSQFPADPLFRGSLDEVILTPYALTQQEIAALQTNQPPQFPDTGDGTWSANADGAWSDATRWGYGLIANGAGYAADFSTLNITANRIVTVDSPRRIGELRFGDTSGVQNWTLVGDGSSVLTLDTGSATSPAILVNQNVATLSVPVAGTHGLTKSGAGTLSLTTSNSLSGALNLDRGIDGNNNDGITRLAHPNAAANVTALNILNTSVTTGGATLQLDGSAGSIVLPQTLSVTCRSSATPAIQNLSGTNTLAGSVLLGVGGTLFNIQSDSGLLVFSGTNRYVGSLIGGRTYAFSGAGDHLLTGPILNSVNGAPIGLAKTGAGTLTLAGLNTYASTTTIGGGKLIVDGTLGLGTVTVSNGATLGGRGTIRGPVTIQSGGVLAPGGNAQPFGTLTISNSVALQTGSSTRLEISNAPLTNDQLRVTGALTRGGTLVILNVAGALTAGDTFRVLDAATSSGSFASVILPPLESPLRWNTNQLFTTGVISVVAPTPPKLVPQFNGSTLVLQAEGEAGFSFVLESATNFAPPVIWTPLQTNQGTGGSLLFEFPADTLQSEGYFRLRVY